MTISALWTNDGAGWRLLAPTGFPDERSLHDLIIEAPELLPLSGSPDLHIIGREVRLGTGYADALAVERSGRFAIIEIKLARNEEARRAVVAQVLAYAAALQGWSLRDLERSALAPHLRQAGGFDTLAALIRANDQAGAFDAEAFESAVEDSLAQGRFRLIFVLDDVPKELQTLVAYLQSLGEKIVIDLISFRSFDVNGSQVLVPQRMEPERRVLESGQPRSLSATATTPVSFERDGQQFARAIEEASTDTQPQLRRLYQWATELRDAGLARFASSKGTTYTTLMLWLPDEDVSLVALYNTGHLSFYRTVFDRRAPKSLPSVEGAAAPVAIGRGNWTNQISDQLLASIRFAYEEARRLK